MELQGPTLKKLRKKGMQNASNYSSTDQVNDRNRKVSNLERWLKLENFYEKNKDWVWSDLSRSLKTFFV